MAEAKWYVVHTYSGYENKVKANIDKTIENRHLEDEILEVRVPMQEVVELNCYIFCCFFCFGSGICFSSRKNDRKTALTNPLALAFRHCFVSFTLSSTAARSGM